MKEKIVEYVLGLFSDIEDSKDNIDKKEELADNMYKKAAVMVKEGVSEEDALCQIKDEFEKVIDVADGLTKKKRFEIIDYMYNKKDYLGKRRTISYIFCIGLIMLGISASVITYMATGELTLLVATLLPLFAPAIVFLIYLYLTQETKKKYPLGKQRALFYSIASLMFIFGLIITFVVYIDTNKNTLITTSVCLPFLVPSLCIFAYLFLTDGKRKKEMAEVSKEEISLIYEMQYKDPRNMQIRALLSGVIWIFSIAIFVLFGFILSFKVSWIIFLFSVGVEVLVELFLFVNTTGVKK